eukprot:TRINITY_DN2413_c0_g2_i1.p1 TRINITY_DN2413_c0_g2~~TRINITY_DN2413_c0_g2_i1.p1  ORF type:complete len:793 (+),score=139.30 TRINITY_DN2413_c0_g2_i1:49-2427(+)
MKQKLFILMLLLVTAGGLKIGVFDSNGGADTQQVISAVNGATNIEVEQISAVSIDSVRTAVAGGVVAFIGPDSAASVYAIQEEMKTQQTPLVSTALRRYETSFNDYTFVSSVQQPIQEFASKISQYAVTHKTENIAFVHDSSTDSLELASQLAHLHDLHPSINRIILLELPKIATSNAFSDIFSSLKQHFIELVVVNGADVQVVGQLLEAAASVKELHVGRVWLAVQLQYNSVFEQTVLTENLMQLRQTNVPAYDAGVILTSALSTFTTNPPNPWDQGDAVRRLIEAEIVLQQLSPLEFYICENRDWGKSAIDTWPLGEGNRKSDEVGVLEGITFRVLFKISEPYIYEGGNAGSEYTGFIVEFEERVREILGYDIVANYTTESYADSIKLAGNPYDIIFGDFTISQERQELYDMTQPFLETSDSMIMRAPEEKDIYLQWLKPFSYPVWIFWCLICLFGAIALFSHNDVNFEAEDEDEDESEDENEDEKTKRVKRMQKEFQEKEKEIKGEQKVYKNRFKKWFGSYEYPTCKQFWSSFVDKLYIGFVTLFQQPSSDSTVSKKILLMAFAIANLIFTSTYTAQLAALLAEKDKYYFVNHFSEIRYGEVSLSEVVIPSSTSNQVRFDATMGISDNLVNKGYVESSSPEDMVTNIRNNEASVGIYDAIWTRWQATSSKDCDIVVHGNKWNHFGFGFALPKSSPYTSVITEAILDIRGDYDFITALEDRYFIGSCPEIPTADSSEVTRVDWSAFLVVWSIIVACYIISFFLKIYEWRTEYNEAFAKYMDQKKQKNQKN